MEDLESNGDLRFQVDFRSVYATVLQEWLAANAEQMLGRFWHTVNFL